MIKYVGMKIRLLKVNIFVFNVYFWFVDYGVFEMFIVLFIVIGYRGVYV